MGLENIFLLRKKSDTKFEIQLSYFCRYWDLQYSLAGNSNDSEIEVKEEEIKQLYNTIDKVYEILKKYTHSEIHYFDDYGYPDELMKECYSLDFNPTRDGYGLKLMHLHDALKQIIEILELNDDDYYITFISSY